jgi:drug/metabolite transporter (DMT)-like permease
MRPGTVLGALLILAGVIALSVGGFSFSTRDKVAEIGPVQVTTEHERAVPLSPLLGAIAIGAGVILIVASSRKAS